MYFLLAFALLALMLCVVWFVGSGMNERLFWFLITLSRWFSFGNIGIQGFVLMGLLFPFRPEKILVFGQILNRLYQRAYHWDLWGAAYIILGGCGDDAFLDFRGWLISRGRGVYERALKNPEWLATLKLSEEHEFESMLYMVPALVYAKRLKKCLDDVHWLVIPADTEPVGTPWEEDDLPKRFPVLARQYNFVD